MNLKILMCLLFCVFSVLNCYNVPNSKLSYHHTPPSVVESSHRVPCLMNIDSRRLNHYKHTNDSNTIFTANGYQYYYNYFNHYFHYYYYEDEQLYMTCDKYGNKYKELIWENPIKKMICSEGYMYSSDNELKLKAENDYSTILCKHNKSYNRYRSDFVNINVTFVSISHVQYNQLQGLDVNRLNLILQNDKSRVYTYEFYDGEEINATCAQEKLHLYWKHVHPWINSLSGTCQLSPIIYNKVLSRSDDGSSLYCRCYSCTTNYAHFNIKLSIKFPSFDLYSLDRNNSWKILNLSPIQESIYEYYDGEMVRLKCQVKHTFSFPAYQFRWHFISALNTSREDLKPDTALNIFYNVTLGAMHNGSVLFCETYYTYELYSNAKVTFHLVKTLNNSDNSIDNKSFNIRLAILITMITIMLLVLAVTGFLFYRCHRTGKTNVTSTLNCLNGNYSQPRINSAYDQSAGSNPLEDAACEQSYDEIGQGNANAGQVSYATIDFGNELYAKPTPKALRQNKQKVTYAQVLFKKEQDKVKENDDANDAVDEDTGYYNTFENQLYVNN